MAVLTFGLACVASATRRVGCKVAMIDPVAEMSPQVLIGSSQRTSGIRIELRLT